VSQVWRVMKRRSRFRQLQMAVWSAMIAFCSVLSVYVSFPLIGMLNAHVATQPGEASADTNAPALAISVVLLASLAAYVISGWIGRRTPVNPMRETDLTNDRSSEAWRIVENLSRAFSMPTPLLVIERDSPGGAGAIQFHRFRKICVSPDLLEDASHDELEAVLAHEMSHLARNDSFVGCVLRAGVMLSILTAGASVVAVVVDLVLHLIAGTSESVSLEPAGMMTVGTLLAMASVLCDFAAMRCQEHIADMDAATITGSPRALISFLTRGEVASGRLFTPLCTHPLPVFRCIALSKLLQEQLRHQPVGASAGTPAWSPAPIPSP